MNPDILGDIEVANPPTSELPIRDSLDRARRVFRKARHESLGGPTVYTQGNNCPGYDNQERFPGNIPSGIGEDPIADQLGVDNQE